VGAGPHAIVTLSIWARNKLRKLEARASIPASFAALSDE
jgi:hypothetical protein